MITLSEEKITCMSCLAANSESAGFCVICGSPLGITSTLDPMKTIQAEGFLLRKATSERPKFIVLLGIWILFLPMLVGSATVAIMEILYGEEFADFIFFLIAVALLLVAVRIIGVVTKNYLTMPDPRREPENGSEKEAKK